MTSEVRPAIEMAPVRDLSAAEPSAAAPVTVQAANGKLAGLKKIVESVGKALSRVKESLDMSDAAALLAGPGVFKMYQDWKASKSAAPAQVIAVKEAAPAVVEVKADVVKTEEVVLDKSGSVRGFMKLVNGKVVAIGNHSLKPLMTKVMNAILQFFRSIRNAVTRKLALLTPSQKVPESKLSAASKEANKSLESFRSQGLESLSSKLATALHAMALVDDRTLLIRLKDPRLADIQKDLATFVKGNDFSPLELKRELILSLAKHLFHTTIGSDEAHMLPDQLKALEALLREKTFVAGGMIGKHTIEQTPFVEAIMGEICSSVRALAKQANLGAQLQAQFAADVKADPFTAGQKFVSRLNALGPRGLQLMNYRQIVDAVLDAIPGDNELQNIVLANLLKDMSEEDARLEANAIAVVAKFAPEKQAPYAETLMARRNQMPVSSTVLKERAANLESDLQMIRELGRLNLMLKKSQREEQFAQETFEQYRIARETNSEVLGEATASVSLTDIEATETAAATAVGKMVKDTELMSRFASEFKGAKSDLDAASDKARAIRATLKQALSYAKEKNPSLGSLETDEGRKKALASLIESLKALKLELTSREERRAQVRYDKASLIEKMWMGFKRPVA